MTTPIPTGFSRPWKSHIPDAIDDLVAFLQTATAGTKNLAIKDGPWTDSGSEQNVIVVGWYGFPVGQTRPAIQLQEQTGQPTATSTGTLEGLGGGILEVIDIDCASLARNGDATQVSAARRTAFSNIALVGQIIAAHFASGQQIGKVMQAVMGSSAALHQTQDRQGCLAVATFSIQAKAYAQQ